MLPRAFFKTLLLAFVPLLTHCATPHMKTAQQIRLLKKEYLSYDGDHFPYRHWEPKNEVNTVIIGLHGISGAASDYIPLAVHSLKDRRDIVVYAPNTRGQGRDPVVERRGHIHRREQWFRDLYAFTALVRGKFPGARIIWCGESMGSLIALHAYANFPGPKPPCDALILVSPIVGIKDDFPKWKQHVAKFASALFPTARISLETLYGKKKIHVTRDAIHSEQVQENDYNIESYTLRLLTTLGDMAQKMPRAAQSVRVPTLVLHGGKDIFTDPQKVARFVKNFPAAANVKYDNYPESYHLLFHDYQREKVIADLLTWIDQLEVE